MRARREAAIGGQYRHVLNAFNSTPWAILPETLDVIAEIVSARLNGEVWDEAEIEARIGRRPEPAEREAKMYGSVALLPLEGVLFPRANVMTDLSGATSTQMWIGQLQKLVDDEDVEGILLDVNSPGGAVDLIPETAAAIRELKGRKPIHAIANTMAASAAYWLASQTDRIYGTPSGKVGSVGIFGAHIDRSGEEANAGLKTTLISAGKYKVEGNPFEPLTEDARAAMQERVDETYGVMTADIAKGRGITAKQVVEGFGEGRVLSSRKALAEGMIDKVATLDDAITAVQRELRTRRRQNRQSPAGHVASTVSVTESWPNVDGADQPADETAIVQTFSEEATAALRAVDQLLARCSSLADVQRKGRLTSVKRDTLDELAGALRVAAGNVEALLAETAPDRHREAAAREHARLLRQETIERGV